MAEEKKRDCDAFYNVGSVLAFTVAVAGTFYFNHQVQERFRNYDSISKKVQEVLTSNAPSPEEITILSTQLQSVGIDGSGLEAALQNYRLAGTQNHYLQSRVSTVL